MVTLYKVHSNGKIGTWSIDVETGGAQTAFLVTRSAKVIGGKEVETRTQVFGKNIGRANETTDFDQAMKEMQSKINKKLDSGYVTEQPEEGAKATNSLGQIKPMLAHKVEDVKDWSFPVYVQPKFDGHRMLATVVGGQVMLYSRRGKELDVEHIRKALQVKYATGRWDGTVLDGEVYAHGETLQRISSLVKKPKPESKSLTYQIYDVNLQACYSERFNYLLDLIDQDDEPCLAHVDTHFVESQAKLEELHAAFLKDGYEGTIIRLTDSGYEDDKRSRSLLKLKNFQDEEFEVIGTDLGKPNERLGLQTGIYLCRAKNGKEFRVLAPGDAHEKHHHAMNGSGNIGKKLTVKFFNLTPDGIPFHPVALRIREDV